MTLRALTIALLLAGCRDRRPPPPPCGDVNAAVTEACRMSAPLYCETATDEHIRCVDEAFQQMETCGTLRQATTVCLVKHGE